MFLSLIGRRKSSPPFSPYQGSPSTSICGLGSGTQRNAASSAKSGESCTASRRKNTPSPVFMAATIICRWRKSKRVRALRYGLRARPGGLRIGAKSVSGSRLCPTLVLLGRSGVSSCNTPVRWCPATTPVSARCSACELNPDHFGKGENVFFVSVRFLRRVLSDALLNTRSRAFLCLSRGEAELRSS